jgi:hypothetical protein
MRKFIIAASIIALTGASASALGRPKFSENITLPSAEPVKVTISLSDDLAHRANNLPEKLRDRSNARGLNNGWAGNGFYGERELARLQDKLLHEITGDFGRIGVTVSDSAAYELRLTLVDARPNHPTFTQLGKQAGLSRNSRALGGARFKGELFDGAGQSLGTVDYHWYENSFEHSYAGATWKDARRAISRFSSKTAKGLLN